MTTWRFYTSGATNIFKYPELSDKQSAQEIISAFEEKQQLAALVTKSMANGGEDRDIQVYIGDESNVENMKDCSVVTATYELGEGQCREPSESSDRSEWIMNMS